MANTTEHIDLVPRLRELFDGRHPLLNEAADEIERLRRQLDDHHRHDNCCDFCDWTES